MKMTLNIDDELLDRVMEATGAKTKTEAIDLALKEADRRARLIEVLGRDRGMSPEDWKNAFAPDDDFGSLRVAEEPVNYAAKPRPRR